MRTVLQFPQEVISKQFVHFVRRRTLGGGQVLQSLEGHVQALGGPVRRRRHHDGQGQTKGQCPTVQHRQLKILKLQKFVVDINVRPTEICSN